jgi:hypothetical protein
MQQNKYASIKQMLKSTRHGYMYTKIANRNTHKSDPIHNSSLSLGRFSDSRKGVTCLRDVCAINEYIVKRTGRYGPRFDKVPSGASDGEQDEHPCCCYVRPTQEGVFPTDPGDSGNHDRFRTLIRQYREVYKCTKNQKASSHDHKYTY